MLFIQLQGLLERWKVVVVRISTVAAAVAMAEWGGPIISCPNHRQRPASLSRMDDDPHPTLFQIPFKFSRNPKP